MKFKPGESGNPGGRPVGSQNRVKKAVKEAFQELIESNFDNLSTWLNKTAANDPGKALDIICKLSEFVTPKLSRVSEEFYEKLARANWNRLILAPLSKKDLQQFEMIERGDSDADPELVEFNKKLEKEL
jgi:hypothetical protein